MSVDAQINRLLEKFDVAHTTATRLVHIGELTHKIGWQKPASFRQVLHAAQDVEDGIEADQAIDNNLVNPNTSQPLDHVSLRNAMEREGLGSTRILADALVPEDLRPAPVFDIDSLEDDWREDGSEVDSLDDSR